MIPDDAMSGRQGRTASWEAIQGLWRSLLVASIVLVAAVVSLTILLGIRRIAGAACQPLGAVSLVLTALILAAVLSGVRKFWDEFADSPHTHRLLLAASIGTSLTGIAAASALTVPGSPAWAIALLWIVVLGQEGYYWLAWFRSAPAVHRARNALGWYAWFSSILWTSWRVRQSRHAIPSGRDMPGDSVEDSGAVTQQFTRVSHEDGSDVMSGLLRARFASGERQQSVHLAICPPAPAVPSVAVEQVDGPPTKIQVSQVETFGIRFDLRLQAPASLPTPVAFQFYLEAGTPRG